MLFVILSNLGRLPNSVSHVPSKRSKPRSLSRVVGCLRGEIIRSREAGPPEQRQGEVRRHLLIPIVCLACELFFMSCAILYFGRGGGSQEHKYCSQRKILFVSGTNLLLATYVAHPYVLYPRFKRKCDVSSLADGGGIYVYIRVASFRHCCDVIISLIDQIVCRIQQALLSRLIVYIGCCASYQT